MCACFEAALRRTQLNIFSGFGPFIRQNNTFEYAHLDDLESLNLWLKQQGVVANPKEPTWLYVCFMIPPSLQNAAKQLIRLRAFFILLLAKKKTVIMVTSIRSRFVFRGLRICHGSLLSVTR